MSTSLKCNKDKLQTDTLSKMASLHNYTQNIPLTQKAKFWSNYVSALKGLHYLDRLMGMLYFVIKVTKT